MNVQTLDKTCLLPKVPGYTLHAELGKGGFATVYRATQQSLNRTVAVKIMNPAYAANPDLCTRFIREGRDLAAVSEHEAIVTVYDVGHEASRNLYYIAMQFLPGPTLKQLIRSDKPYQHPLHIIRRVAQALAHAHSKGLVHRDIKPANILFNAQGKAVLSDFGIAKTQNRDEQLTQMGQLVGTELYMSCEQAMCMENIDGRSDLYSLGVVFFETLTRRLPYTASGSQSVIEQHISAPVPQLPETEAQFQPLLDKLMAKNPDDRYQSADELLDDIQRRYFNQSVAHSSENDAQTKQIRWWLPTSLAALLIIVAVVVGLWFPAEKLLQQKVSLSQQDQITIEESMELAELNELLGRIDAPPGSNAIELYQLILEIDPTHEKAQAALDRLTRR